MVLIYHACAYQLEQSADLKGIGYAVMAILSFFGLGVPMFFVISGYCISAACDRMRSSSGTLREYLKRRYFRIFPPFWILVAITAVVVTATDWLGYGYLFADNVHPISLPSSLALDQWAGNLTLTESFRHALFGSDRLYFLGHAWSLCYEEQFYLVCGVLLAVSRTRFFVNAAILTALVVCVSVAGAAVGVRSAGFFYDGRWLLFALGMLVYWTLNHARPTAKYVFRCGFVCSTVGLLLAFPEFRLALSRITGLSFFADARGLVSLTNLLTAVVFATTLLFLHRWDTQLRHNRLLSPITWCGTMCYSVYLVHWPVVKPISHLLWRSGVTGWVPTLLVTVPICAVFSIALARLFHCYVERRFLNKPHQNVSSHFGLAAAAPVLSLGGMRGPQSVANYVAAPSQKGA
jgi:peptidoglycan/LPS O-acetylase OafA/YrhL